MSGFYGPAQLAATGSTGNNTHAGVPLNAGANKVAAVLIIEAVGATPTITAKLQGTLDDARFLNDASANWFDLMGLPNDSDTSALSITKTALGTYVVYLSLAQIRFARRVRLVTSANTNVTYRGELYQQYTN